MKKIKGTTLNSLNFLMVYLVVVLPTLYDSLNNKNANVELNSPAHDRKTATRSGEHSVPLALTPG
jgi:hypothetical protein